MPVPNSTAVVWVDEAARPEPERSPCMVGVFPIVYYSVLLGLGLPGEGLGQGGLPGTRGGSTHPASSELCPLSTACALSCRQSLSSCPSPGAFGDREESPQGWGKPACSPQAPWPRGWPQLRSPAVKPSPTWQVPWQQGQMVFALVGLIHGRD